MRAIPVKTYLVTGAAGFIGSHLCKKLLENNNKVIGVDCFTDYYSIELKKSRVLEFIGSDGLFLDVDLSNRQNCRDLLMEYQPTHVIHLAAQAGIRLPISENGRYVKENLVSFVNIASESVALKVKNFLYASSSSVYGKESQVPFTETEEKLFPVSFYGLTKLFNEQIIANLAGFSSTRFRGMRLFTVYGPWGRPDMAYFKLITKGLSQTKFQLNGNGNVKRDFTYIDDVVSSIIKLSTELNLHQDGFSDIVNVGGGKPVSIKELISTIEVSLEKTIGIDFSTPYVSDLQITNASTEYQKFLIGNSPGTPLYEGILRTVEWAKRKDISNRLLTWSLGHD